MLYLISACSRDGSAISKFKMATGGVNKRILIPFRSKKSISISGPTNSGKTMFVYRFLTNMELMYEPGESPSAVLYCYGVSQPLFHHMKRAVPIITFYEGLPSNDIIEDFAADHPHSLIILDDLHQKFVQERQMETLLTMSCHHRNMSVIFINHNIFYQGKHARTMALNTSYNVLFRNVRDQSQVAILGRQMYPNRPAKLLEAYNDATSQAYGYLLIDYTTEQKDDMRLRTNIFPGEQMLVYVDK